ncbi:hypothetical protein GOBAR_DD15693 [Gossypium barbadense]|nr:hypothetical protein GOBAR_DD15693 [Gossypium barbadense]
MVKEKSNREAMYRVFKSLWFTKEEVNFVALNDGAIIVKFRCLEDRSRILNFMPWLLDNCLFAMMPFIKGKDIDTYEFNMSLFWLRVYNIPLEYMDCQTTLGFGNAIGELVLVERDAIEIIRVLKYERLPAFCYSCGLIGHTTTKCKNKDGASESNVLNLQYRSWMRANTVVLNQDRGICKCKMDGCLTINANGKSGGLVMIWKEGTEVKIINYSSNHIDSLIHLENDNPIRFMGFYGKVDPNKRHSSWNMLRRVGKSVKEKWIIRGDFNAILENAKKEGDFREVVDELSMVDLKTNNRWFTWVNNREGTTMAKERLDHFLMSSNGVASFLFMETKVICQSTSNHAAIVLDTEGHKPRDGIRDPRLNFRYDVCWDKEYEANKNY